MRCYYCSLIVFFFFFKQKTAYEMRISDWSSDVCSSDLRLVADAGEGLGGRPVAGRLEHAAQQHGDIAEAHAGPLFDTRYDAVREIGVRARSEERRVGKEGVSTCRSRWWQ